MKKFQKKKINKIDKIIDKALCLPSGYNLDKKKLYKIVTILKNFE